jgi:hypothetical protein
MVKSASASKLAEWKWIAWKKIAGKTAVQSFKKCCSTNAFDGAEVDTLRDSSDFDCPLLECDIE